MRCTGGRAQPVLPHLTPLFTASMHPCRGAVGWEGWLALDLAGDHVVGGVSWILLQERRNPGSKQHN